jgi:hypothetical protein
MPCSTVLVCFCISLAQLTQKPDEALGGGFGFVRAGDAESHVPWA